MAVRFIGEFVCGPRSRVARCLFRRVNRDGHFILRVDVWLLKNKFGYQLQVIRDDEEAAAASGVRSFRTKMLGLALSAGMTALAGALYVQFYLAIDPGAAFGLLRPSKSSCRR